MTTIQLTSATRAVLNDNGSEQVITFDVQAKKGINVAKNGTPYLRLPKNSTGRSSVSLKVLENGEPYELTERREYSQAPKNLDGTSDATIRTSRKPKADQLNDYVTSLATFLDTDDQTTFLDLLTKAMTRKQARDTLDELKALYTQRQQETDNLLNQINELEGKLAD